jgi:polar amino acid transport system permease protein
VRLAIPQTVGFLVQLVKNSAVGSLIGFLELTRVGQLVSNATFDPLRSFLLVALFYFIINYPLSLLSGRLERRLNVGR